MFGAWNFLKVSSLIYPRHLSLRQNTLWIFPSLFILPLVASRLTPQDTTPSFIFRENHRLLSTSLASKAEMSAKRDSPSAQRNKGPIWEVLSTKVLSSFEGSFDKPIRILEIAAGCGVHTDHFVSQLSSANKHCDWYPTDPSEVSLQSIQCYIDEGKLSDSIQSPVPLTLDATGIMETSTASKFDEGSLDLIMCINMIHISPWSATLGLMKVAGEKLSDDGSLYCYGPYKVGGTAVESNL